MSLFQSSLYSDVPFLLRVLSMTKNRGSHWFSDSLIPIDGSLTRLSKNIFPQDKGVLEYAQQADFWDGMR